MGDPKLICFYCGKEIEEDEFAIEHEELGIQGSTVRTAHIGCKVFYIACDYFIVKKKEYIGWPPQ